MPQKISYFKVRYFISMLYCIYYTQYLHLINFLKFLNFLKPFLLRAPSNKNTLKFQGLNKHPGRYLEALRYSQKFLA